jgi:hypothetical protein
MHNMLARPGQKSPAFFAAESQIGSLEKQPLDGKGHNVRNRLAAIDRDDKRRHCQQDPQRR